MSKKRNKPAKAAPADYDVGYGKPPAHSRWGPGQSGNPGGRKTGQRNFKTMVLDVFEAEIDITENGRRSKRTVAEALLLTLVQGGLKDRDFRALNRALELYERFADKGADQDSEAPSEDDLAIIRRAMHGDEPDDSEQHATDDDADETPEDDGPSSSVGGGP